MRKLEVKLDGTALPLSSKSILDLKIDLRSVECTISFINLISALAVFIVENFLKSSLSSVSDFDISHEVLRPC